MEGPEGAQERNGDMAAISGDAGNRSGAGGRPAWLEKLSEFERPDVRKASLQLLDTVVPYLFLWFFMVRTVQLGYSYWVTLALSVPAAGLLVRIFIFFHDCCHGSFLADRRANALLGHLLGILTFTPFEDWRYTHGRHHATVANLDYRGEGDIWTMTLEEYLAAPRHRRWTYRLFRNPLVLFGLGPLFYFLVRQRFPSKGAGPRARRSVLITDLALLAIVVAAWRTIGLWTYLVIQIPVIYLAGAGGFWLFYVQHQFEGVYWARKEEWDAMKAALQGSSFYQLPRVLQWFSGNIGLHYIHHIRPRIPNYRLQSAYQRIPELHAVPPLTLGQSLRSVRLKIWDEGRRQLVGWEALRTFLKNRPGASVHRDRPGHQA